MIKVEVEFRGAHSNVTIEIHLERWKSLGVSYLGLKIPNWKIQNFEFKIKKSLLLIDDFENKNKIALWRKM